MIVLLGAVVSGCQDPELEPLSLKLDAQSEYTINGGESATIPYTLDNLTLAYASVTATSSNADFATSVQPTADDPYTGTVTVTAPKYIFNAEDVTVTVKAVDNGQADRNNEQTFKVSTVVTPGLVTSTTGANSFIVPTGSLFGFMPYKGNTTDKADISSVQLLWQDKAGMVEDLFTKGEYVYVKLAAGVSGNAVVVAGSANNASWSWNLWVTDYNPEADMMEYTDANGKLCKFMDRNLGATTNKMGTDEVHGNFYQWGRKDAFSGSTYENSLKTMYNLAGEVVEKTIEPCAEVDNMAKAIANPLTHYSGVSGGNYSWLTNSYASAPKEEIKDYWGGASGKKSQYDPCPAGWRVPTETEIGFYVVDKALFTKTYATEETTANKDFRGWTLTKDGKSYFFPAQGEIPHGGKLTNAIGGTWPNGKLWSGSSDTMATSSYFRARSSSVSPSSLGLGGVGYGYALPVRCVKE